MVLKDKKEVIIEKDSLRDSRWSSGCTVFNSPLHGNRPIALVVGAWEICPEDVCKADTTEVLDFTKPSAKWERLTSKNDP